MSLCLSVILKRFCTSLKIFSQMLSWSRWSRYEHIKTLTSCPEECCIDYTQILMADRPKGISTTGSPDMSLRQHRLKTETVLQVKKNHQPFHGLISKKNRKKNLIQINVFLFFFHQNSFLSLHQIMRWKIATSSPCRDCYNRMTQRHQWTGKAKLWINARLEEPASGQGEIYSNTWEVTPWRTRPG